MRQSHIYLAIKECKEEYGDPVELSCDMLGVSRAAYYRWLSGKKCDRELENEKIAEIMEQIHTENPDKGYRRIKDDLAHDHNLNVNEKRMLRICRSLDIKSTIKYKNNGCTRQAANPQHIAKNWLNRQFHASMPNEKWLTDVTEFSGTTDRMYTNCISARSLIYMTAESLPLSFATGMTILLYLIPWMPLLRPIQMHTLCSTVTEGSNIQTGPSITS